jgi:hypothetical protein
MFISHVNYGISLPSTELRVQNLYLVSIHSRKVTGDQTFPAVIKDMNRSEMTAFVCPSVTVSGGH